MLERSSVDRMVGAPERLVFEGAPILVPPLAQEQNSRRPITVDGVALDTVAACPPLTVVERAKIEEHKAKQAHQLAPERARARSSYVERKTGEIVERAGLSMAAARRVIGRQCEGILLSDVVLPFDDEEFVGCSVADVLRDPRRFVGATLADPIEGPDYGRCVAKVMRRQDGTVSIHSFAHGRTVYDLKYDAAAVRQAIEQTANRDLRPAGRHR